MREGADGARRDCLQGMRLGRRPTQSFVIEEESLDPFDSPELRALSTRPLPADQKLTQTANGQEREAGRTSEPPPGSPSHPLLPVDGEGAEPDPAALAWASESTASAPSVPGPGERRCRAPAVHRVLALTSLAVAALIAALVVTGTGQPVAVVPRAESTPRPGAPLIAQAATPSPRATPAGRASRSRAAARRERAASRSSRRSRRAARRRSSAARTVSRRPRPALLVPAARATASVRRSAPVQGPPAAQLTSAQPVAPSGKSVPVSPKPRHAPSASSPAPAPPVSDEFSFESGSAP